MTTWCTCARPRSSMTARARASTSRARVRIACALGLRDRATGQLVKARVERDGGYSTLLSTKLRKPAWVMKFGVSAP